jgi:type II secretory pathway pseudopilin PulG
MKNLTQLKMKLLQKKRQRGLTLVEVGLAVAISAVIVVGVLYMYESTATSSQVYQFNTDVTNIRGAVSTYVQSTGTSPTSLGDLISNGYLKLGLSNDGKGADPWTGDYTLKPNTDGTFTVTATKPTANACSRLGKQWSNMGTSVSCTPAAGFAATFTY